MITIFNGEATLRDIESGEAIATALVSITSENKLVEGEEELRKLFDAAGEMATVDFHFDTLGHYVLASVGYSIDYQFRNPLILFWEHIKRIWN